MRTKTLVLTALSSLSAIGLMAQTSTNVYSLNAVGYINVTVPAGFSIIADQLWVNSGSPNYIGTVLPADFVNGTTDTSKLYKFNGGTYSIYTVDSGFPNGWFVPNGQPDPGLTVTLNPGEAAFFNNTSGAPWTYTFVGTVPQGTNTVAVTGGFNLISSPVPQSGGVTTTLGLPVDPNGGQDLDKLYLYNAGYTIYTVDSGSTPPWDLGHSAGVEPSIPVGTGFFYYSAPGNTPPTWTRVFSVNQ